MQTKDAYGNKPLLSICIPSYNRPALLKRVIESIIQNPQPLLNDIEIVISDDSTSDECSNIVHTTMNHWQGKWSYRKNEQPLGMAKNWNNAIRLSSGKHVLVLHDDDFLTKQGLRAILASLYKGNNQRMALLFSVSIVDIHSRKIRESKVQNKYMTPAEALENVLFNSSFIRFPGIVLHRRVFQEIGYFNENIGEVSDLDMWIRVFGKYGLYCYPEISACYTIHHNALTAKMFSAHTVLNILNIFDSAQQTHIISENIVNKCKANFLHQFILAGTVRAIKNLKPKEAKQTLSLLKNVDLNKDKLLFKWKALHTLLNLFLLAIPHKS